MFVTLGMVSGFFWTLTYILIIRQGFQEKSFGMPLAALCANISWEFLFAFVYPHRAPQLYINYTWFFLDAIILLQVLKFWRREFPGLSSFQFYTQFGATLGISICLVWFITLEFENFNGHYTAFGQNLLMSILFINMLSERNSLRGQSVTIALFKLLGTLAASVGFYFYARLDGLLLTFLYSAIFAFDLIYLMQVYQRSSKWALTVLRGV